MSSRHDRVYIVIVNWNGWAETLECLESIFRSDYPDYRVIVYDNASSDGSVELMRSWAEGGLDVFVQAASSLRSLSFPPVAKPLSLQIQTAAHDAGTGHADGDARLTILCGQKNIGFAGGNNAAIRFVLDRNEAGYFWLLNNDTVVEPGTLTELVTRVKKTPDAGICGSTLLYYDYPDIVQAYGGIHYNKWLALSRKIGEFERLRELSDGDAGQIERTLDGISGASVLVTSEFIRSVGLMCEEYFLYYEELDWAYRAGDRFSKVFAHKSKVFHREGASTGASSLRPREKSRCSDFYSMRGRLLFTRKFNKEAVPTVYISLLASMFIRIFRLQWDRIRMIIEIMSGRTTYHD